jgi:predicted GIY-YIG superfamily endonuclease
MAYIYGLCDADGTVRYIGKANNVEKRLASHMREKDRRDYPVYRWLRKNGRPKIVVLHECGLDEDWREVERRLIAEARARGEKLLNVADGGDEPHCPPEVRQANSQQLQAHLAMHPEKRATAGRAAALARTRTPEAKELWKLKKDLGLLLKQGFLSNAKRAQLREAAARRPDIFACFANIPDRTEDASGRGLVTLVGRTYWS